MKIDLKSIRTRLNTTLEFYMLKQWIEGPNQRLNKIVYHTGKGSLPEGGDGMVIEISENGKVLFYQTAKVVGAMSAVVGGGHLPATISSTDKSYHTRPRFDSFEAAKESL